MKLKYDMHKGKGAYWALFTTSLLALLTLIALQCMTTFTSDDYYYARFWQNGLGGFIKWNIAHFYTRNGRVIVHLLAETFLALGMPIYAVFNTMILLGVFCCFFRFQNDDIKLKQADYLVSGATFFLLILLAGYRVLKSWILCVADSCNYMFPFLLLGVLLLLLDKASERRRVLVSICAFFAGATTEMCGMIALVMALLYYIHLRFIRKQSDLSALLAVVFVLLGLLSVFASPATRQRTEDEFSLVGIAHSFVQYANSLAAPGLSLKMMIMLCFLMGIQPIVGAEHKFLYTGLPVGIVLTIGYIVPRSTVWNTVACMLFFAYILSAVAFSRRSRNGHMLLCGLCSAGIVVLTKSCSVRVTTPLLMIMILCSTSYFFQVYLWVKQYNAKGEKLIAGGLCLALFAVISIQYPTFKGVYTNYLIMKSNEDAVEQARETHILAYTDYEPFYCLSALFMDEVTEQNFLAYYKLTDTDIDVVYTYEVKPIRFYGIGEDLSVVRGDKQYIPLRAIATACGGNVEHITDGFLKISIGDETYIYHEPSLYVDYQEKNVWNEFVLYEGRYYVATDILEQTMGINCADYFY